MLITSTPLTTNVFCVIPKSPAVYSRFLIMYCYLLQEEPYIMKRKAEPGETLTGNDRFEGYCKDLADLIAKRLNINCE